MACACVAVNACIACEMLHQKSSTCREHARSMPTSDSSGALHCCQTPAIAVKSCPGASGGTGCQATIRKEAGPVPGEPLDSPNKLGACQQVGAQGQAGQGAQQLPQEGGLPLCLSLCQPGCHCLQPGGRVSTGAQYNASSSLIWSVGAA